MEIPIYSSNDLFEGTSEFNEFSEFISHVIQMKEYHSDIEFGICRKIESDGTEELSDKQLFHIRNIVNRNSKECAVCGERIPLNEVFLLEGDLCSYHQHTLNKND